MERASACLCRNHRRQKPGGWLSVLAFRVWGAWGGRDLGAGKALQGSRGRRQISSVFEDVMRADRLPVEEIDEDVAKRRHDIGFGLTDGA